MSKSNKGVPHKTWVTPAWGLAMTEKVKHMGVAQGYWYHHQNTPLGFAAHKAAMDALLTGGTIQTLCAFGHTPNVAKFLAAYDAAVVAIQAAKKGGAHH
jgi:hypothetical protein